MFIPLASSSRRSLARLAPSWISQSVPGTSHALSSPVYLHNGPPAPSNAIRASSTTATPTPLPDDIVQPLKRSPYRLLPLATFLLSFAPLHVVGWKLVNLSPAEDDSTSGFQRLEKGIGTLEGKKLVRAYSIPDKRYEALMDLVQRIGQAVQEENHHPTIIICPGTDYVNALSLPIWEDKTDHIIEITMHTHTPLPETKTAGDDREPGPGVTGKDLKLAERIESIWEEIQAAESAMHE